MVDKRSEQKSSLGKRLKIQNSSYKKYCWNSEFLKLEKKGKSLRLLQYEPGRKSHTICNMCSKGLKGACIIKI